MYSFSKTLTKAHFIDKQTRSEYEARGMPHFAPSADFESKKYFQLPEEILEQPLELLVWVRQAVRAKTGQKNLCIV